MMNVDAQVTSKEYITMITLILQLEILTIIA